MTDTLPVLYLLPRTDMASMNSGRVAAQVSHAANHFVHHMAQADVREEFDEETKSAYFKWSHETNQGFGTAIVLDGGKLSSIEEVYKITKAMGYQTGITVDPTYVIKDGDVVHLVPDVPTVAWVFVPDKYTDEMARLVLQNFPLFGA